MSKVNPFSLSSKEKKIMLGDFFEAIANLKSKNQMESFFKDLLTDSEFVMLSRRLQVAKMLLKGRSYNEIVEQLKAGKTTIAYVDKWLNQGLGGYRTALEKAKKEKRPIDYGEDMNLSFSWLRKKYPAHFWLINLIMK